ncbi:hypothetical protein FOL46_007210 [Perkinsus olseni]|uniref:Uncharacterized protein n=1 Tax=Perkinsus olseni TaxID=32597 RepID=A0A7J6MX10_PEROL|nr:hypothetical protein FOL46_007210 [Perkinsus olseni]
MNPFLCSTVALESAAVKSRFRRYLSDGGFLNDVGREVSAFLGKSSRELTFNCPSNTVMLPDISFMFIRRGVLMVARCLKEELALVPLFSPAAAPQLCIPRGDGSLGSFCYHPVEDALYILYWKGNTCSLYVHSLADGFDPSTRIFAVEGMLNSTRDISICRSEMALVSGRLYLACSVPFPESGPFWLVCLDVRNKGKITIRAQIVWTFTDSSCHWPMSPIVSDQDDENSCVLCVTYCIGDEEWVLRKLLVAHRGGRVSVKSLCSWPIGPPDATVVEYQVLKKNLLLLCGLFRNRREGRYFYSLCNERGRELGMRRHQLSDLEPVQSLIADDGTIFIQSGLNQMSENPVDCINAFHTQARHLMCTETPSWFFDGDVEKTRCSCRMSLAL